MILRTWLGIQQMAKVKTISPEQAGGGETETQHENSSAIKFLPLRALLTGPETGPVFQCCV